MKLEPEERELLEISEHDEQAGLVSAEQRAGAKALAVVDYWMARARPVARTRLEQFAQVLRGYQGMGLSPTIFEDSGAGPWEKLPPDVRAKWLSYAEQVLHSAKTLEEPAEPASEKESGGD